MRIIVPEALSAHHEEQGEQEWSAALPALAASYLERWELRVDGEPMHGVVSLVIPVLRADGSGAALKLQPVNEENATEAPGLRTWAGDGSVLLLDEDAATGTLLLERLDGARTLASVPDDTEALGILGDLLARLVAVPAPAGLRRLGDIARQMLADVPAASLSLGPADREWLDLCAGAVRSLVSEPGDRLLHWDLHYDNVLAADREPWLAIDPKPLAGDPGFDLWPSLHNRWDDVIATGDVRRGVLRRFDQLVERLGLDPSRAAGWTLGRILQNALWDVADGKPHLDPTGTAIAEAMTHRH